MRVTVQFDIDADQFADADDLDAACASVLHRAAGRIIKDGLQDTFDVGFEVLVTTPDADDLTRLDGLTL